MRHFVLNKPKPYLKDSVKGDLSKLPLPLNSLKKILKGVTILATGIWYNETQIQTKTLASNNK